MSDTDNYEVALARCEADARSHGHTLGAWLFVNERLHGALCEACGMMVWVALPGGETNWRAGGTALEEGCLEEEGWISQSASA